MEKLGDLIKREFKKSGLSAHEFGNRIYTTRENVYKILEKNSIDVELLGRISKALNHNFFADVANNLDLVTETSEELAREKAIMQFLDIVPKVMHEMGRDCLLQFDNPSKYKSELPLPDYYLCPYSISFTYGESYKNRMPEELHQRIKLINDGKGHSVEIIYLLQGSQCCNIVIDYKTEVEWRETMNFALNVINHYYTIENKMNLERLYKQRIKW